MPSKIVVLISGQGTNLQAIINAISANEISNATVSLVISNRKNAYGLERAQEAGISTAYINLVPYGQRYPSEDESTKYGTTAREAYDADLAEMILAVNPDMVVMAGFMHIVSNAFLDPLEKADVTIMNLHPALPGEFDGAGAIQRAFEEFKKGNLKRTGIMCHHVIRAVDRGPPLITQEVEIRQGDSLEDLQARMHDVEHHLIVQGVSIALQQRIDKNGVT